MSHPLPYRVAQVYERHVTTLSSAVSLPLVAAVCWQVAALAWLLAPTPEEARWRPPPVEVPVPPPVAAPSGVNIESLIAAQIFGAYRPEPAGRVEDAPDTRLALELLGVLLGEDERSSRALIGTDGGLEKPFAVGDEVARDARLHAVFEDRVVLERSGSLETLRLKREALALDFGQGSPQAQSAETSVTSVEAQPRTSTRTPKPPKAHRPPREKRKDAVRPKKS